MTTPPQGGWQPDPHGWPPQGQPQYGPPQGYSGQQPPGFPPGQWPQQPPPAKGGGSLKWLLVAVAVLLVISISVGVTLIVTRDDGDEPSQTADASTSDIASANDTGPVAIIMEEPTCKAFIPINDSLAAIQQTGWGDSRSRLGALSSWTSEQRSQVGAVADAMTNASDQFVSLARMTPHRVMRELYEQYIAYARAFVASLPRYSPRDNALATVNVAIGNSLAAICLAVDNGASGRMVAVTPLDSPARTAPVSDPAQPERFLTQMNPLCGSWVPREARLGGELSEWSGLNANKVAAQWSPLERSIQEQATTALKQYAEEMAPAASDSGNPVIDDFGSLSALYLKAYASAADTYTSADSWLSTAGLRLSNVVTDACRVVEE